MRTLCLQCLRSGLHNDEREGEPRVGRARAARTRQTGGRHTQKAARPRGEGPSQGREQGGAVAL